MNGVDASGWIKFAVSVADVSLLEFLGLILPDGIYVDVCPVPANSFACVISSTCCAKGRASSVPRSVALGIGGM